MSKRIAIESRIVDFFTNAPIAKVEVVFNIIAPVVKQRRASEITSDAPIHDRPKRKPRKKRQPELPLGQEVAS